MPSKSVQLAQQLGRRIADLRQARGLTQERLAWDLETNKGYMSRIEAGQRLPSLDVLQRLAKRLRVEIRDLFIFPEDGPVATAMELVRKRGARFAARFVEQPKRQP